MSNKKIALITGANKGIGLETARQLGKKEITVLVGARDAGKGESAVAKLRREGIDAHPIVIDVSDPKSVKEAAGKVEHDFGRLDILVNNAGVLADAKEKKVSEQSLATWRQTFDTNVFGLIATTQAFLPLLRKSEAARIVNLSSILGSISFHATPGSPVYEAKDTPAYNVSKAAVNAYTVQLAHELKETSIKVNAAHPGWVKTEMGGAGAMMEIEDGAKTSVALATAGTDAPNGTFVHMGDPLPW
jgi:NAD(P)-dependent dehydrogenase (short-subunit alcohol dehydrogenase family)